MKNDMTITDKILLWQTVATFLTFGAAGIATYLAWRIGRRQNEINKQSLDIQNFVETFVMPQQVIGQDEHGIQKILYWNLLVKNASSYPIYLNRFVLSGVAHLINNSVIPTGGDNWYAIPVPQDAQQKGELSLELEFEDYLGNKYLSRHYGKFENLFWQIHSEKRIKKMISSFEKKIKSKASQWNLVLTVVLIIGLLYQIYLALPGESCAGSILDGNKVRCEWRIPLVRTFTHFRMIK